MSTRKATWENRQKDEMAKPKVDQNKRLLQKYEDRIDTVNSQLREFKAQLRDITNQVDGTASDSIVFQINDSTVSMDTNGFVPTKNTYVVVYHLM